MSVNIYNKETDKLIKIAGNANGVIDDANVSNKTTYSSDKIVKEIDGLVADVVTENLNGKKLIPKTQEEYDALSDAEKNKEDIIYLITDYTGGGGSEQPQETIPSLRTRLKLLVKKSVSSSTGEVIDDTKKACTNDFIEVTPGSILEYNYNKLWGIARGFDEVKNLVTNISAINENNDPMFSPTGLHQYGKYTIPENVKYIKMVFGLNAGASIEISQAVEVTGYDIQIGNKIYNTVGY